jgi:hypothetical protein
MSDPLHGTTTFPVGRAFVIKLHRTADPQRGTLCGRVEHIASGRQADFAAATDLVPTLCALCGSDAPAPPPQQHQNKTVP